MRMKALVHLVSSPRSDHFKCVRVYGKVQEEVESERARKWVLNIFFIFNSHSPWEYDWVDFFAVFVSCLFHIKVKRLNTSVSRIFFFFLLGAVRNAIATCPHTFNALAFRYLLHIFWAFQPQSTITDTIDLTEILIENWTAACVFRKLYYVATECNKMRIMKSYRIISAVADKSIMIKLSNG